MAKYLPAFDLRLDFYMSTNRSNKKNRPLWISFDFKTKHGIRIQFSFPNSSVCKAYSLIYNKKYLHSLFLFWII